ncbi:hypothetical protein OIU84_019134 [Salix udensis]|uniref:Uncharacterized protein n=1 Tax=Salix udensis TaxID=889485 RepID=A0AAD6L0G3_9ROSI|nr:hypothetical protein OIU84_019134 [Salix udensis]
MSMTGRIATTVQNRRDCVSFCSLSKPELSQSMGPILVNSGKSEDWFLNALNGADAAGLLNRGFSDSASVNCLLGLDCNDSSDGLNNGNNSNNNSNVDLVAVGGGGRDGEGSNKVVVKQDVHSVPDSPMLENSSSFGSTSSSPSLANLPPIRVHVEDGGGVRDQKVAVGIEDQFAQMTVGGGGGVGQRQDDGFVVLSSPPPPPVAAAASGAPVGGLAMLVVLLICLLQIQFQAIAV